MTEKYHFQASIYYICTMYKNPGEHEPPVPAADAYGQKLGTNILSMAT